MRIESDIRDSKDFIDIIGLKSDAY